VFDTFLGCFAGYHNGYPSEYILDSSTKPRILPNSVNPTRIRFTICIFNSLYLSEPRLQPKIFHCLPEKPDKNFLSQGTIPMQPLKFGPCWSLLCGCMCRKMQGKVVFELKCKRVTNVFENGILEYSALSTCEIKLLNFLKILPAQVQQPIIQPNSKITT
jgi:hypothetical protein